mmetsp:Transcript_83957/g.271309  ORF Transcript_83957/g.271309 Transcript_83957/m.271309 type:complete len:386 (+) Transcript_83957:71-1228(+)
MGAQCGRDQCDGGSRYGEAPTDDLQKDEPVMDADGPLIRSLAVLHQEPSSAACSRPTEKDLWSSEREEAQWPRWNAAVESESRFASSTGEVRALSQPPRKNPRMFSSAPGPTLASSSPSHSAARERWERTGRRVGTAVLLTKLLRASPTDVPPVKCAVSLEKLNEFSAMAREAFGNDYSTATFRSVVQGIIQPQCDQNGKAYARTLNGEMPCTGQVFVCHCWDGCFHEFVACINHLFRHWPRKPNLWISGFALVQSRRRIPFSRPMDAPFAAALKAAHSILVVRNEQVDLESRIWPLWELYLASKFGMVEKKGGILFAGNSRLAVGSSVDCQKALATIVGDKAAIDAAITEEGGYAGVNAAVAKVLGQASNGGPPPQPVRHVQSK